MRFVLAGFLVLAALVMVFHVERLAPVPGAVARWTWRVCHRVLPFQARAAYAAECIAKAEKERDALRHDVSRTAVELDDVTTHLRDTRKAAEEALCRIQEISAGSDQEDRDRLASELAGFRRIEARLEELRRRQTQLADALAQMEDAEDALDTRISQLTHRLRAVEVENRRHGALELAMAREPGQTGCLRTATDTINRLEFDERVREDLHQRYGEAAVPPTVQRPDPSAQAEFLLDRYGAWLQ